MKLLLFIIVIFLNACILEPTVPTPPPTNHHGGITVNDALAPIPKPGISGVLLTPPGAIPPLPAEGDWAHDGAFRLFCNFSKMSYDDPIVYPGQPGFAHHHTFFGNTAIDAFTTSENIRDKGNATCRGGTINLSGYWTPSMVDTVTHAPIEPHGLLVYYKTGWWTYLNNNPPMNPLPKGLKIIAGNATSTAPGNPGGFTCLTQAKGYGRAGRENLAYIPSDCVPGEDDLRMTIPFPQCWDGKNLDSPDHKSHMAYPIAFWSGDPARQYRCPETHPVVLPQITFIVIYNIPADGSMKNWRLASDSYDPALPGGYSRHGDWLNGWDQEISDLWGKVCLSDRRDCGTANLGDGRVTLEFQGN